MNHSHMEFRVWDKTRKCWMLGTFPFLAMKQNPRTNEPPYFAVSSAPNWSVVRGTGIGDSKGEMLWEGDVVRRMCFSKDCDPVHFGIIEYDIANGGFSIIDHDKEINVPLVCYHKGRMLGIERLGNVFENPELAMTLEQKVAKKQADKKV